MTPPLFWVDEVDEPGSTAVLDGAEGRHAVTVKRIGAGETLLLGDGRGAVATAVVQETTGRDSLVAQVTGLQRHPRPRPTVTVVQALPKADRAELAVDLMTEAGADEIVPWQAARCVARWSGVKADKGVAKWRNAAAAAAKQSRRPWLPEVADLATTSQVRLRCSEAVDAGGAVLILHEAAARPLPEVSLPADGEILLVVGPEGGLDETEVADLTALGAVSVRLGPEVLRTATAAAVALGALGVLTDRWAR